MQRAETRKYPIVSNFKISSGDRFATHFKCVANLLRPLLRGWVGGGAVPSSDGLTHVFSFCFNIFRAESTLTIDA